MTTAPRPRATAVADLTCPLCGWVLDSEVDRMTKPDNLAAAPGVARALGVPTGALLSIHQNAARRRDEHAIERHMSTHGPADWLPALTAALSATHHLELATTSAAERTKIIDQAALIAQMGGVSDDMLVALLTLAAARAMTPNVEAKLREQGIEPDPRRVQERVDVAQRDPRVGEAIESISVSYDDAQAVTAAGKTLPPRKPVTCGLCGRARELSDHDYYPWQVVTGQPIGWYSGSDGEVCPECMTKTIRGGA